MSYEIEKKFSVVDYDTVKKMLDTTYGQPKREVKAGYWWSEVADPSALLLELQEHKIQKKNVETLNAIAEVKIDLQDFQYVRIRVVNNEQFVMTLKNKALANGIEQNIEYEYELDQATAREVVRFLSQGFYIFYYNSKDTLIYTSGDARIELSKISDLSNAYLEIEVSGSDKKKLNDDLVEFLKNFDRYPIKEETLGYNQLSKMENASTLKNKKVKDYSRDALKQLNASLTLK